MAIGWVIIPIYFVEKGLSLELAGLIIGVISMDVSLTTLNNDIISTQVGRRGYAFLIDSNGRLRAHPELSSEDIKRDETYKT